MAELKLERYILFGSYAYGNPNVDSNLNLLVVVTNFNKPRYRRARQAYKALRGIEIAKDILVMTLVEVEQKSTMPSELISQVIREGKVLYGSS